MTCGEAGIQPNESKQPSILNLQVGDTYELLTCKGNPYYVLVKRIPEGMEDVPKWYEKVVTATS
ncbi:MAG TPA: hypothetical protein VJZ03_05705 [Candidatus Bathyarchaeia archaeon]|nr:hypothetical protein [Candidatus Bathyarchaeia archaeon]